MNFTVDITGIAAMIISGLALFLAWRKTPHEIKNTDADAAEKDAGAAEKYEAVATRAAERALKLDARIVELEGKVREQQQEIILLRSENAELRQWSERLVYQVQSLGGIPVKMRVEQ